MIRVEVIENFSLKDFDELQNIERKNRNDKGQLYVEDTFECSEDMAKYLMGGNDKGKVVVKVIEVEPKEVAKEVAEEAKEEPVEEKPKKKKSKN